MNYFKILVLNWSFVFGVISTTAIFSGYIFGDDNLYEEIVEAIDKITTGEDKDLTPDSPESKDLNDKINALPLKDLMYLRGHK